MSCTINRTNQLDADQILDGLFEEDITVKPAYSPYPAIKRFVIESVNGEIPNLDIDIKIIRNIDSADISVSPRDTLAPGAVKLFTAVDIDTAVSLTDMIDAAHLFYAGRNFQTLVNGDGAYERCAVAVKAARTAAAKRFTGMNPAARNRYPVWFKDAVVSYIDTYRTTPFVIGFIADELDAETWHDRAVLELDDVEKLDILGRAIAKCAMLQAESEIGCLNAGTDEFFVHATEPLAEYFLESEAKAFLDERDRVAVA